MKWLIVAMVLAACQNSSANPPAADPLPSMDASPPSVGANAGAHQSCDAGIVVQDAMVPVPHRSEGDLVSFVYRNGSVPAGNWMTMTIEPSRNITFEDSEIIQKAELFPAEYKMVLDYVLSPEFVDAVRRPTNPDCTRLPDVTIGLQVTWRDVGMQSVSPGS